jgi:hypothetical protein
MTRKPDDDLVFLVQATHIVRAILHVESKINGWKKKLVGYQRYEKSFPDITMFSRRKYSTSALND